MKGVNKVILVGTLGKDPETKYMPSGNAVTSFSVATSESWKDKSGEKQESTEWHNITMFGKLAEIAEKYLKKGSKVYLEGKIKTEKYQAKDGTEKSITKIVCHELQMLDSKPEGAPARQAAPAQKEPTGGDPFMDDIPFSPVGNYV